tara:strand:- start:191 stop:445 length:255 start_codon:yes stop_codon:yes gene_type:complete
MPNPSRSWADNVQCRTRELHCLLKIGDRDWHKVKGQPKRRAAELISAALVLLLNDGKITDVTDLIEQSLKWLRGEIRDPGCPDH